MEISEPTNMILKRKFGQRLQTRRELIDTIEDKPPRSFTKIRRVLQSTVRSIRQEIAKIEKEYIGDKKDVCEEIRSWVVPLKAVLRGVKFSELNSSRNVEQIMARVSAPGIRAPVDPLDLLKLNDCVLKVREYVPFKFNRAVELTQKSLKILQKYCLSFYDIVNDPHLETAHDFHTSAISIADKVKVLLEKSRLMAFKFQTELISFNSDFFGFNARQIAARCECENLPFLMMFPQVLENMLEVCSLLDRWIEADQNYAQFIRNDIVDIDEKRHYLIQKTRDLQEKCYHLNYKYKLAEQETQANMKELMEVKLKSAEFTIEEEFVRRELNDKKVDLEIKEFKKAELVRNSDTLVRSVFQEQLDLQTIGIKKIKDEVRLLKKKLESIQSKGNRTEERQDILVSKENMSYTVQKQLSAANEERAEGEMELSSVNDKLELAKRILLHKTCVENLEKVFYSLPLDAKSPRQAQSEEVVSFDRTCEVVAATIAGEWSRLYRELPFIPARGRLNIEDDIEKIVNMNPRDGHAHHALRALNRWRRFNNRAKMDDLRASLKRIRRQDIVEEVERTLNPPEVIKEDETPPPTFLAHYLIPSYKEVERYDQLRAANRIPPLGWEKTRLIL